jgi:ATP-binding cassette subfamily B (MDR/TAP) protein 1
MFHKQFISSQCNDKKNATIWRILRFARPEYHLVGPGLLATILRGCSWPVFSIVYGRLFKSLSNALTEKSGMSMQNFGEFLLLGTVAGILTFLSGYFLGTSGEKMTKRMRHQLLSVSIPFV